MHWWPEDILAGKDLQAGGTWLGVNRKKRFALLTNIRPGYVGVVGKKSRGDLITQYLTSNLDMESFQQSVEAELSEYAGFNLLLSDGKQLCWFSSTSPKGKILSAGIYGLSNDSLDTRWPKVELAKLQLEKQLRKVQSTLVDHTVLQSFEVAAPSELPRTGVPQQWESLLSAQCITGQDYGTRTRSHIIQRKSGEFWICEQQIDEHGNVTSASEWHV
jgi:uncharacterized protein with NRDE domain